MRMNWRMALLALLATTGFGGQDAQAMVRGDPDALRESERAIDDEALAQTHLSPYVRGLIAEQGGSSVPVLLPFEPTQDAEQAAKHEFRLKITGDGYSARLRIDRTDIVIYGTRVVYIRGSEEVAPSDDIKPYEDFDDGRGGSISFHRYGADYHVEFYCIDMTAPGTPTCIDGARARDFVENLR